MDPTEPRSAYPPDAWARFLSSELRRPVRVLFGRARRHVIVARERGRGLELRMNAHFAAAPPRVRDAVASWLRSGRRARRACEELDRWIAGLDEALGPRPRRRVRLVARGEHHDLAPLLDELATELGPELVPPERLPRVTWGRRGPRRVRRTLELGSFDPETRIVRIHPVLDQRSVPRFFVRYVLFHELLHAALDGAERTTAGRRLHHGPRFRRAERAYADHGRALAWQERHLAALIRSARTGRPLRAGPARAVRTLVQGCLFPD